MAAPAESAALDGTAWVAYGLAIRVEDGLSEDASASGQGFASRWYASTVAACVEDWGWGGSVIFGAHRSEVGDGAGLVVDGAADRLANDSSRSGETSPLRFQMRRASI